MFLNTPKIQIAKTPNIIILPLDFPKFSFNFAHKMKSIKYSSQNFIEIFYLFIGKCTTHLPLEIKKSYDQ